MIDAIVRETGMGDALRAENTDEAYSRLENLGELASAASQYDTLLDFVERMALVSDADQLDSGAGAISLMTLHVAKGLEYPAVVIAGLEETVFPHRRAIARRRRARRGASPVLRRASRARCATSCSPTPGAARCGDSTRRRSPAASSTEIPPELVNDLSAQRAGASPARHSTDGFLGRDTDFTRGAPSAPAPRRRCARPAPSCSASPSATAVVHDRYGPGVVDQRRGHRGARAGGGEFRRARGEEPRARDDAAAPRERRIKRS